MDTPRTSRTDPLRIDRLRLKRGMIGMTICPGKIGPSVTGPPWRRDMATDLDVLVSEGVTTLLTLMEWSEMKQYQVQGLKLAAQARGLSCLHFPIRDRAIPNLEQFADWREISACIRKSLDIFGFPVIHCLGGLGRTGVVTAMLLQDRGESPSVSIDRVRAVHKGAIETGEQEVFVRQYADWRKM